MQPTKWKSCPLTVNGRILACCTKGDDPSSVGVLVDAVFEAHAHDALQEAAKELKSIPNKQDRLSHLLREAGKAGLHRVDVLSNSKSSTESLGLMVSPIGRKFVFYTLNRTNGSFGTLLLHF
jgi:hypothetical protein